MTAREVAAEEGGSRFLLSTPAGEAPVRLPLPGPHQVMNFLAAAAIAFVVGVSPADCARAAAELRPPAHRGEWKRHASGARLYDDSYNANPSSMRAALETLAAMPARRRIAVLGDMLELGPEEERFHLEAGRAVAGRADLLVCVGPRARALGEGAVAGGAARARRSFTPPRPTRRRGCWMGLLADGDVALFKASRGIGLDRAVDALASAREGLTCCTGCSFRSRIASPRSTSSATSRSGRRWRR